MAEGQTKPQDVLCNSAELLSKWHAACKDTAGEAYTKGAFVFVVTCTVVARWMT